MARIQENIATAISQREEIEEKAADESRGIEEMTKAEVEAGSQVSRDLEQKILRQTDEKVYSLKSEVSRERKGREEALLNVVRNLSEGISSLEAELSDNRKTREAIYDKVIKKLGDQIIALQEKLASEKRVTNKEILLKTG